MTQNVCCGYDEHWDYMRFFWSVFSLFPNRDELHEFFLKVSSKRKIKQKRVSMLVNLASLELTSGTELDKALTSCCLFLFNHCCQETVQCPDFFNNKNTPSFSFDNTAAGIAGFRFSHTHPDTKEKEYRDSLLSDNTYQKFWRSQFSQ